MKTNNLSNDSVLQNCGIGKELRVLLLVRELHRIKAEVDEFYFDDCVEADEWLSSVLCTASAGLVPIIAILKAWTRSVAV